MATDAGRGIKTADNVAEIFEFLDERGRASLPEVADHVGLTKSTTYRYLDTLLARELLVRDVDGYGIGLKFLEFGGGARDRRDLYRAAKPELRELLDRTGHSVYLAVEEHDDLVILESLDPDVSSGDGSGVGQRGHLTTPRVGQRAYLHTPALGKAILAHLPETKVDSVLSRHGLPELTEESITERAKLEAELERVREQGYAVNDEEQHRNYKGIARPVLVEGDVVGAVSVTGPKADIELETDSIHDLLQSAVDRVEIKLEYD